MGCEDFAVGLKSVRSIAKNQHAKWKILSFKNWHSTKIRKIGLVFRKQNVPLLRNMNPIFSETCKTVKFY